MSLGRLLRIVLSGVAIAFIVGAAIGTLAIPVILAIHYSWYWLFLYAGYLLMILYVVLYCVRYGKEG